MAKPLPVRFNPGDELTAEALNAIVRLAIAPPVIRGDGAITVVTTDEGVSLSLSRERDYWVPARITAAPAPGVAIAPGACLYSAAAIGEASFAVANTLPRYRNIPVRPGQTPAPLVFPAEVGDDCHIVVGPDPANAALTRVRLAVWTEGVDFCPPAQEPPAP